MTKPFDIKNKEKRMKYPLTIFNPTENEYVGINFADLRYLLAVKRQNIKK